MQEKKIKLVDHRNEQFLLEKRQAIVMGTVKRLQNVIAGLRMKKREFDEVFGRVYTLASDVVEGI